MENGGLRGCLRPQKVTRLATSAPHIRSSAAVNLTNGDHKQRAATTRLCCARRSACRPGVTFLTSWTWSKSTDGSFGASNFYVQQHYYFAAGRLQISAPSTAWRSSTHPAASRTPCPTSCPSAKGNPFSERKPGSRTCSGRLATQRGQPTPDRFPARHYARPEFQTRSSGRACSVPNATGSLSGDLRQSGKPPGRIPQPRGFFPTPRSSPTATPAGRTASADQERRTGISPC